jgi:hypothetical protein
VIGGRDGSVYRVNHYAASYRPGDTEIDLNSGEGCNCEDDMGGSWSINLSPQRSPDLLGTPHLTPTYMFGLNAPGIVSSQHDYDVALIDTPVIAGAQTYHLRLSPLSDAKNDRLRELWIGMGDYLPRKAVISGNFARAPFTDVPWTIQFSIIDGAPFITRETTSAVLFLPHRQVIKDATIVFEEIRPRRAGTLFGHPLIEPALNRAVLLEPGI